MVTTRSKRPREDLNDGELLTASSFSTLASLPNFPAWIRKRPWGKRPQDWVLIRSGQCSTTTTPAAFSSSSSALATSLALFDDSAGGIASSSTTAGGGGAQSTKKDEVEVSFGVAMAREIHELRKALKPLNGSTATWLLAAKVRHDGAQQQQQNPSSSSTQIIDLNQGFDYLCELNQEMEVNPKKYRDGADQSYVNLNKPESCWLKDIVAWSLFREIPVVGKQLMFNPWAPVDEVMLIPGEVPTSFTINSSTVIPTTTNVATSSSGGGGCCAGERSATAGIVALIPPTVEELYISGGRTVLEKLVEVKATFPSLQVIRCQVYESQRSDSHFTESFVKFVEHVFQDPTSSIHTLALEHHAYNAEIVSRIIRLNLPALSRLVIVSLTSGNERINYGECLKGCKVNPSLECLALPKAAQEVDGSTFRLARECPHVELLSPDEIRGSLEEPPRKRAAIIQNMVKKYYSSSSAEEDEKNNTNRSSSTTVGDVLLSPACITLVPPQPKMKFLGDASSSSSFLSPLSRRASRVSNASVFQASPTTAVVASCGSNNTLRVAQQQEAVEEDAAISNSRYSAVGADEGEFEEHLTYEEASKSLLLKGMLQAVEDQGSGGIPGSGGLPPERVEVDIKHRVTREAISLTAHFIRHFVSQACHDECAAIEENGTSGSSAIGFIILDDNKIPSSSSAPLVAETSWEPGVHGFVRRSKATWSREFQHFHSGFILRKASSAKLPTSLSSEQQQHSDDDEEKKGDSLAVVAHHQQHQFSLDGVDIQVDLERNEHQQVELLMQLMAMACYLNIPSLKRFVRTSLALILN